MIRRSPRFAAFASAAAGLALSATVASADPLLGLCVRDSQGNLATPNTLPNSPVAPLVIPVEKAIPVVNDEKWEDSLEVRIDTEISDLVDRMRVDHDVIGVIANVRIESQTGPIEIHAVATNCNEVVVKAAAPQRVHALDLGAYLRSARQQAAGQIHGKRRP